LLVLVSLVAAACGDDDDDDSTATDGGATEEPASDGAAEDDSAAADDSAAEDDSAAADDSAAEDDSAAADDGAVAAASLADVCPSPLVIQSDWFAESEHGALYNLVGDGYTVDIENMRVRGPMVLGGEATGIDIEVRMGGPSVGFQPPAAQIYADDSIHLAFENTEGAVGRFTETPLLGVMAPLDINPQIIMWDPETYPDVKTIADVGESGMTINLFAGGVFGPVFVAQGIWSQDQIDESYDGSPARFIAEGNIAQQGFASAEPWQYKNEFTEFGRDVAFQLLHDAGFEAYPGVLSVRPDQLETLRPCLEAVVPVFQQSTVDFYADPSHANAVIVDAVAQVNSFWIYSAELAEFSVQTQLELGLGGNGPDSTVGNMDLDRVQGVIDTMTAAGMEVPEGLTADQIVTNEFIDDSIGLP
jgi:hypothetical protein